MNRIAGIFRNGLTPRVRRACMKAYRLQRDEGLGGAAIGAALDVPTDEGNTLAAVGFRLDALAGRRLSQSEVLLLESLARAHMNLLNGGSVRSPKSKEVEWFANRAKGWCARTINKRLRPDAEGGFGLAEQSPNGHCWLTPSGWTLVLALHEDLA